MSVVSLLNVDVKNNPAPIGAEYEFEITFECLEPLQKGTRVLPFVVLKPKLTSASSDLEWKLTYVGSATS